MLPPCSLSSPILMVVQNPVATARPSACLLSTYLSDEFCAHNERAVFYRQRKCRQTPRRRPGHNLRAVAGVIFGVVARALENVRVAAILFDPVADRTSRVRTNRRIGDDPLDRPGACFIVEFAGVKFYEHDFVQARTLADHCRFWILWPCMDRRSSKR